MVTKLKKKYSNCYKTKKLKLGHNSKTEIVTNPKKEIMTKLKNGNCDKNLKLKLWKTQIASEKIKN